MIYKDDKSEKSVKAGTWCKDQRKSFVEIDLKFNKTKKEHTAEEIRRHSMLHGIKSHSINNDSFMDNNNSGGLVITNDSVYEYDMDCLKKNKKCY